MKNATSLFLFFISFALSAQEKVERRLLLQHHIGEMRIYTHFVSEGKLTGDSSLFYLYKYDEKGNLTEDTRIAPGGIFSPKFVSEYQRDTFKTGMNAYRSDGSLSSRFTYEYDAAGNCIYSKQISMKPGSSSGVVENFMEYDKNRRNTATYANFGQGKHLVSRKIYDENGRCVREFRCDPGTGIAYDSMSVTYNAQGLPDKKWRLKGKRKKTLAFEYVYDENGRLSTLKEHISRKGKIYTDGYDLDYKKGDRVETHYRYDKRGLLAEKSRYINSRLMYRLTYSYSLPSPHVSQE